MKVPAVCFFIAPCYVRSILIARRQSLIAHLDTEISGETKMNKDALMNTLTGLTDWFINGVDCLACLTDLFIDNVDHLAILTDTFINNVS